MCVELTSVELTSVWTYCLLVWYLLLISSGCIQVCIYSTLKRLDYAVVTRCCGLMVFVIMCGANQVYIWFIAG